AQAELARPLGHHLGKFGLGARDALRQRDAGVVRGLDDDAVQKIVHRYLAVDRDEHARRARGAPPLRQALVLTMNSVLALSLSCLIRLNTSSAVISLERLAGGMRSSAAFSNSTVPLSASINMACAAAV